ncbi:MAG: hypothetical protein HN548_02440 [Opitutae bacterium]|nr:hypothetical protein [Opitutae bacterium]
MAILIKATGFILSLLPYEVLEIMTECLARIFMLIPSPRRRVLLSNLRHAFPDWSYNKVKATALESAARMFEMGFFSLCYPFMTKDQLRRTVLYSNETEKKLAQLRKSGKPVLFLIPHVCLFEALATSPFFRPQGRRKMGAIYRPNRSPWLENWIRESRIATGLKVFSRNTALFESKRFLREKNWLALLFDQNSGIQGCHSNFLKRFASLSTLPSLFAQSTKAITVYSFPKRIAFFKTSLELTELECLKSEVPFKAHELLELNIFQYEGLPEWLWSHERWKTQQNYRYHLRHRHKRSNLQDPMPRTTKFWIRIPNWLGDVVMTFPLIKAIRKGRPDASIALIGKSIFREISLKLNLCDDFIALPYGGGRDAFTEFIKKRYDYPSLIINFANSLRSDLECRVLGAPRRYGLLLPGKLRPFLTHAYQPSKSIVNAINETHQVNLWEGMLNYFGLAEELDLQPYSLGLLPSEYLSIGIIPGSANNPSKRWSTGKWCSLIRELLNFGDGLKVNIFGTKDDCIIADEICSTLDDKNVHNLCGKTSILELGRNLSDCIMVVGNDSGGMHLANALGAPTVVLFGPTNPLVTSPFMNSTMKIIRSSGNKKNDVLDIDDLSVNQVLDACVELKRL